MKEKNINSEKLTKVIITHQDLDHIGSLAEIKKEIQNIKIYAHKLEITNPNFTLDMKEAMKSINNLLNYEIEEVICFHGGIVRGDIKSQIKAMNNSMMN